MADLLFVATLAAFFGLCVLFIKACDRMIEHSDVGEGASGAGEPDEVETEAVAA